MKNQKMSTIITIGILVVNTIGIYLLYLVASRSLTVTMRRTAMENLHDTLNVQTQIIEEYVGHQEDLLINFSNATEVKEFLKNPDDVQKQKAAQKYTEEYYGRLENWEGLYIGEWNTHIITHSNPQVVGMVTREGEPLKQLQNEMIDRNGLYNAGIIVSPASQKLILSLYCPVYDEDGSILGYVGGGPFVGELEALLAAVEDESTNYYMINTDSFMYIFARDKELIATEIKDKMLFSIIATFSDDSKTWIGDMEYQDAAEGDSIAAYQYLPEYEWAVVSCNSEADIYADVNKNITMLAVICIVSDLVIVLMAWGIIHLSTRPLKYVEKAIVQLEQMNMEKDPKLNKYINRKSEVGQIATAINSLYDSIGDMLDAEKEKQIAIAASESKAKFLANMSHEIRTPINTVIGMNEMILRENQDPAIHEYADNIQNASKMLLGLINDVLDISKIEAGKLKIVDSDYRLAGMLKAVILGVESRIKQKGLSLRLDFDEKLPSVLCGDEIRIKQILTNLLTNAVKYTEQGSITFMVKGVRKEDGFVLVLGVKDTGRGIKEEDREKLFESFQRLELDKNRHIEGTGLGLNISKQLVESMGGKIEVVSKYGEGSSFMVRIPQRIVDDSTMGKLEEQQKYVMGAEEKKNFLYAPEAKILAVDDNEMNLKVVKGLLKRSGIQLDFALGGNECLDLVKHKKYDVILMDHMMPEPDGVQTLHLIREDAENPNQQTPIIVLTANAIQGAEENYLQEGFCGYLTKPLDVKVLEEMLQKYL